MFRLLRLISYPQLRASWGRTLLVVGGIATGVSLIAAIDILNSSVLGSFRNTIELMAGPAALEVTLGIGEIGFPEGTTDAIRSDPDVRTAVPLVRGTVALADDAREVLQLFGADLTAEQDLQRYQVTAVTDRREALRALEDPRSIFVTTDFADRQRLRVGDVIRLSTPQGVRELTIRGLLVTNGIAAALRGQLAVMDLPAAQALLGKSGRIDQVDVVLRPGADLTATQHRLQAVLPATLTVAPPTYRAAQYENVLASVQAMLTGISTLCLVAGIYIVYNTTSTGAAHRASVMAQLRVVGAEPTVLFRLLMTEALLLGVAGALLGLAYGVALAHFLTGMIADGFGTIFQLRFPVESLSISGAEQASIVLLGIVSALLASYSAARRMQRLEPLEIMRPGMQSRIPQTNVRRLLALWLATIAISAATFVAEIRFKSFAWGNAGSTTWNASIFIIAVPLVGWLAHGLERLLPSWFGAEGRVAADSLVRSPVRAGVTVAAVAFVVGVSITLASLSQSFRTSVAEFVGQALGGDLIVSAVTTEGGWLETPISEGLATELLDVPGVRAVETARALPGQLYKGQRIGVLGLSDGLLRSEGLPAGWYREGDPTIAAPAVRAGRGANLSTSLADRFDLHVGDRIVVDTPTGPLELPVTGVVPDYTSNNGTIIVSRRLVVERWREPMISRALVFVAPGASLQAVQKSLRERFGERYRLKIDTLRDSLAYITGTINRAFAFTNAIQLLIGIVTVAGIFDLLLSAIVERRRELAVWRLIGADERAVRRSVVIESGTVGMIGAVLGVTIGFITAWLWVGINYRYLLGFFLDFHFAWLSAASSFLLVLVMTMLAGYAAARQATRQSVLEGIQQI